jgi:8-oxo-dGTP diphosphatase
MNIFNEEEFNDLCRASEGEKFSKEIYIRYFKSSFFNKVKRTVENDRRGEVVFCVINSNKKIITITCKEYPLGVYRIPTGGIGHNENIISAVYRETKEELGLDVDIVNFAGVLKIYFQHNASSVSFYSYLFILKEKGGRLLLDATDDEVSEVFETDLEGLKSVVENLRNIKGKWEDWGQFRFETSNAILQYLMNHPEIIS